MKKLWPLITGLNIIIALAIINLLVPLLPSLQIDLTENKLHSITDVSRKIVSDLDDLINVKVFVTADLPPEIKPVAKDLTIILKEFERINPSKLKVTFLDPLKDEAARSEATKYGVQALQFSSIKSDKFEIQNGYFGLVMIYGDKQEVLPVAGDVGNLEYFIVSGINNLTSKQTNSISIAEETTPGNQSNFQYLRTYLAKTYNVTEVNLDSDFKIPDNDKTLLILGRSKKIDEKGIKKLEAWIQSGKGIIGFIDRVGVGQNMQPLKYEVTGLEKLFADKGMKIEDKLVMDNNSMAANFRTQTGNFMVQYPYWPLIRPENIKTDIPLLSGINSLMVAWANPIETNDKTIILFTSSDESNLDDSMNDVSPISKKVTDGNKKKYVLGAINTEGAKVALVGDVDMIKDQFVVNNQQNLLFALNLVDYFAQDTKLFAIRSKVLKNSPLRPVSENIKSIIRLINVILPLFILMIVYLVSGVIRKKRINKWYEINKE